MRRKIAKDAISLTPVQCYYYIHNPLEFLKEIFNFYNNEIPPFQEDRILKWWFTPFFLDDSGRSTGKSFNIIVSAMAKSLLIPNRKTMLIGQDKTIGVELMNEIIAPWAESNTKFKSLIKVSHLDTVVRLKEHGATVNMWNGSNFFTMTVDMKKGGLKAQSWRVNGLLFNEWTSYPDMDNMEEHVFPIATRNNMYWKTTHDFQIAMERHLAMPLGRLTDKLLRIARFKGERVNVRPHITERKLSDDEIVNRFYINFRTAYGFDYMEGTKAAPEFFKPVSTIPDVKEFFGHFTDGDWAYQNQITFDGSAKKPEDECFKFYQNFQKQIDSMNPAYASYNIGIDNVPEKYDGIVYNSVIINTRRNDMTKEDFDRVYNGIWVSGGDLRPYQVNEVNAIRYGNVEYMRDQINLYVGGFDSAKGTESELKNIASRGDDATGAIIKLGDGTKSNPHELVYVHVCESLGADDIARDIHFLDNKFKMELIGLDPGGGGQEVTRSLAKSELKFDDVTIRPEPIVPIDYERPEDIMKPKLVLISTATDLIKEYYITSDSERSILKTGDFLNNAIHSNAQRLIRNGGVVFPSMYTSYTLVNMLNKGEISSDEYDEMMTMETAIKQLVNIRYETRGGVPVKTANGLYRYTSTGRKDMAYAIIYALFIAEIYVSLTKSDVEEYAFAIGEIR